MTCQLAIAASASRMIHHQQMDEINQHAERDAFHDAVRAAAARHPSVSATSTKNRSARLSLLIAKARTLASMTSRPGYDVTTDAEQMIDDAAVMLGYQPHRSKPAILKNHHSFSSPDMANLVQTSPLIILVGLDNARNFARFKDALIRAALMDLSDGDDPHSYESRTRSAIRALLRMMITRRLSVGILSDEDLLEMAMDVMTTRSDREGRA